jgi:hypothetical protein
MALTQHVTSPRYDFVISEFTITTISHLQYADAIYVMGADSSNPSSVYIYDANATSWSAQSVNTNGFNPNSFGAVLDHDTNVFCVYLDTLLFLFAK